MTDTELPPFQACVQVRYATAGSSSSRDLKDWGVHVANTGASKALNTARLDRRMYDRGRRPNCALGP